ncbi:histidine--tRNA ligase [Candidatus Pelagibacter sp. HIMB1587]|uniref:histidine--tRNA ligase n=1 Tax=Candidatus Pelagibacter sp. HIMB1587 TaxID=3413354 RepID=UPI003F82E401
MNKDNKLQASLPKGFKDRWGDELDLKNKLVDTIKEVFTSYSFEQLETPEFEKSINIGSFLAEDESNPMSDVFSFTNEKESLTLRYDLSAPLARFCAENFRDLVFPYKRFAYGNVFRQEKADSARYRAFAQLDADIIGDANPSQADAEICNIIGESFKKIGLSKEQFTINVSNKKILQGLINELKIEEDIQYKVLKSIDKLDRLGVKGVEELLKQGRTDQSGAFTRGCELSDNQASEIISFLTLKGINDLKANLKNPLSSEGINDLEKLFEVLSYGSNQDSVKIDVTKIRGLSYYTGYLVETNLNFKVTNAKGKEINIGSVASGGRYDNLISRFKGADYKGTGMSIGIDRLLYAVNQLDQIKINKNRPVLVCILDKAFIKEYYQIVNELRANNIPSEIYLDQNKNLKKQLQYADRKKLDLAIICGENEFKDNTITIKNLKGVKGQNSQTIPKEKLIDEVKKLI